MYFDVENNKVFYTVFIKNKKLMKGGLPMEIMDALKKVTESIHNWTDDNLKNKIHKYLYTEDIS